VADKTKSVSTIRHDPLMSVLLRASFNMVRRGVVVGSSTNYLPAQDLLSMTQLYTKMWNPARANY